MKSLPADSTDYDYDYHFANPGIYLFYRYGNSPFLKRVYCGSPAFKKSENKSIQMDFRGL